MSGGEGGVRHARDDPSSGGSLRGAKPPELDEGKYRRLFEAMSDAFVSTAMDGGIRETNPAFRAMLGYTEEELRRKSYRDLTPERWHAFEQDIIEKQVLSRGYSEVYEKEYQRKDGTLFPVELRTFLLRDESGHPSEMWAIARDITDRRRTEDELRASRAFLDSIIAQSPTPTWISDSEGTLLRINKACCDLLHVTEAELVGKYNVFRDNLVETQGLAPLIRRVYEEHEAVKFRIVWDAADLRGLEFKDHAAVVLHTTVFPIRDKAGKVTNAVFQHLDVTSLTQAELEKSRLEAQLLQAQKMEAIGRLAGGIAHDFNNMLSVIRGYAELLELELPAGGPHHEQLAEIKNAARRSAEITRQLLAFSRRQIIEPRVADLNALIGEMRGTFSRLIGEDIELRVTAAQELSRIRIDPTQIHQLLMNLAADARDAMPKGGLLRIETSNTTLDEAYCREHPDSSPGPHVRLAVADTGIGMDAGTLAQIFEPFFTTKSVGKGTGLGLATVYGIVRQNGRSIAVDSAPGRGTTFRLLFPATSSPIVAPTPVEQIEPGGGTVLLVEDDPMVRATTASMLGAAGYTVHAVGRPQEAVAFCADPAQKIDVMLTDVVMQGMTGAQVRDRVSEVRPGIPVLFMSGYTSDAVAHRGVVSEGVDLIQKPFGVGELARRVAAAIRKRGA